MKKLKLASLIALSLSVLSGCKSYLEVNTVRENKITEADTRKVDVTVKIYGTVKETVNTAKDLMKYAIDEHFRK